MNEQPQLLALREVVLAVTHADPQATLSDVHTGHTIQSFKPCSAHGANAVAPLSATAPHFAALLKDKGVIAVYAHDRDQPWLKCPLPEKLVSLAASPMTGRLMAAGSESGKLYLWDAPSGKLLAVVEAHFQAVTSVVISNDDMLIGTGSSDAGVKVFQVSSLADPSNPTAHLPLHTLSAHTLPVTSLRFSHSPSTTARLFTASLDHAVKVHDLATGSTLATFLLPSPVHALASDSLDESLYVGCDDGNVYVTSPANPFGAGSAAAQIASVRRHLASVDRSRITALAVTPSATCLVVGTSKGMVAVLDAKTGTQVRTLAGGMGWASPVVHLHTYVSTSSGGIGAQQQHSTGGGSRLPSVALLQRFKDNEAAVLVLGPVDRQISAEVEDSCESDALALFAQTRNALLALE